MEEPTPPSGSGDPQVPMHLPFRQKLRAHLPASPFPAPPSTRRRVTV